MNKFNKHIHRVTIIAATTFMVMLPLSEARAQGGDTDILKAIKQDTGNILNSINQLPTLIQNIIDTMITPPDQYSQPILTAPNSMTTELNNIVANVAAAPQVSATATNQTGTSPAANPTVTPQMLSAAAVSAATLPFNQANSNNTANLQSDIGGLVNTIIQDNSSYAAPTQGASIPGTPTSLPIGYRILNDFFTNVGGTFDQNHNISGPSNVNSLTYQNLVIPGFVYSGSLAKGDPDYAYNYVLNAAGITIPHLYPQTAWRGQPYDQAKYKVFYNTVTSIQTFNAYVLGRLYAEYLTSQSGTGYTQLQNKLIQDASSTNWFTDVSTNESIGTVIRQILMFESQLFVIFTQMLDTQRQMVTAQTMTNTLLMLQNQGNEDLLLKNARGQ